MTSAVNNFSVLKNKKVLASSDSSGIHEFKKGRLIKPPQELPYLASTQIVEFNDSLLLSINPYECTVLTRDYHRLATKPLSKKQQANGVEFRSVYSDSKKRAWICMHDGLKLLSTFTNDQQSFAFSALPRQFAIPPLQKTLVSDMLEGSNGDFWFATSQGLVRITTDGSSYVFTKEDGLPSENVTRIFEDKEKNIWAGTDLGLAKMVTVNNIFIHSPRTGLMSDNATDISSSKMDRLLISTPKGIQEYDMLSRQFTTIAFTNDITYDFFTQKKRTFLFYAANMIAEYDPLKRQIVDRKLLPEFGNRIINDSAGNIFFFTSRGLVVYPKNSSPSASLLQFRVHSLLSSRDGYLWAGSWAAGLHRLTYEITNNKTVFSVKDITHFIKAKQIRSLFEDSKGNIWVGTRYDGAFCLSKKNDTAYNVVHIGQAEGLISNWVTCFAEDSEGNTWVGTRLGLDKLILENNKYRVFNFSRINNFFGQISKIIPLENKTIWFLADGKLVQFSDEQLETKKPLPVYITAVTLGSSNQKNSLLPPDTALSLKHYQNQLQFEFSAPGFINEKQILYSYRLAGSHETSWSTPSNVYTVSYASLQPGDYRFEVRTLGWDMQWGATSHFSFSITPPFWITWWFIAIWILLLGFLFYIFYRRRINQFKKLQTVRNRIATDLHDDFGATLTNIGILSELSAKKIQEPLEAKKFLTRITEEVNVLGQSLDDIIWSVNSRHDTMEETLARMRRYAAELFDNSSTLCQLQFDEEIVSKKLDMEQRRDLYLIYKESLNNIYKHAAAKQVSVKAVLHHHHFEMVIKDDGKGFQLDQPSHRNGLKNIRARVEKWKGHINIQTEPGKGTRLHISLPVS